MQDFYYMLVVKPSSHLELFSDFLIDLLPVGFEETEEGFIIRSEENLETVSWGIEQFAEALQRATGEVIDVELALTKEKNDDWIARYQEAVTPVEIDPFYIHPTWEEPKEGMLNIAIDPALAFGTGHHPTTASCLRAVAKYVRSGDTVMDVGCGSGILAMAALRKGAVVDACDTDPLSVENAIANAAQNGLGYRRIWEGPVQDSTERYNVIIANIVADVLVFIASDLKKRLEEGGVLILSGIMDKYEDKVLRAYKAMELTERIVENEWVTLVMTQKGNG
ncbi:50S ribosomal protein L11 methyltransferase [Sulfuricurvum sp. IAE1]|jgi:ribosomal protein L11 methyltransferase|uniref:50S ribosomal protein L11 methyltransferase n=1 Tax=Sulfuricurvum sp. IAE1 TaxID=2546102 RepID=UPI001053A60B|nr:50S ribosomal protein L11 methyltransferase [Sulfuricurvum sp. IAE1]MDD3770394.1 50S ribosomal protein L11 methyltransferase [Sulfuricurvum sp.]MDX9966827.1 50S ribosomal protein L11 methyltransferase [Sulfuricurvum sp.]TDA69280.1 50S ribosomal protein L11 methyltransferase [Sulfuricurvum sp. IAE1]